MGEVSSKRKKKGLALAMVFGSSWAVWMVGWPAIHEIGERLLDFVFCLKKITRRRIVSPHSDTHVAGNH